MKKILLLAGTEKGLFLFTRSDRKRRQLRGMFLKGKEVNHALDDPRTEKIFAAANGARPGGNLFRHEPGEDFRLARQRRFAGNARRQSAAGLFRGHSGDLPDFSKCSHFIYRPGWNSIRL